MTSVQILLKRLRCQRLDGMPVENIMSDAANEIERQMDIVVQMRKLNSKVIVQRDAAVALLHADLNAYKSEIPHIAEAIEDFLTSLETKADPFDVPMMEACPKCYGHHNIGNPCSGEK